MNPISRTQMMGLSLLLCACGSAMPMDPEGSMPNLLLADVRDISLVTAAPPMPPMDIEPPPVPGQRELIFQVVVCNRGQAASEGAVVLGVTWTPAMGLMSKTTCAGSFHDTVMMPTTTLAKNNCVDVILRGATIEDNLPYGAVVSVDVSCAVKESDEADNGKSVSLMP